MKKFLFFLLILGVGVRAQEIGARYLIITHDNFYNDIQPLAEWKHKKGMRTKVVTLSQIGSSSSAIKTYIQNAYNTWQIPPEYVLLVGAPNLLPWGSSYSDNYYMDMTGDLLNEILAGRLTVHNTTEAQTVVNKILLYERTPGVIDSSWFIDACLIVREDYDPYDDSIYWSDVRHARNLMRAAGYDSVDTLSRAAGNSASHILSSVNNGRSFVLYRGQGVNNWWSPFDVNPDLAQNGAMLPIVLSITCSTIGSGSSPAVAEKWLLTGSPTSPRGGAGYFATTTVLSGAAYLRSAVCKGFFNTLFLEGGRTFGQACEGGRLKVYTMYGNTGEYRGFATLGDPEMNIWTAVPRTIDVVHDPSIDAEAESLVVLVTENSAPVESALVCVVLDDGVYEYDYTSNNGSVVFYFDSLLPGVMDITVSGMNVLPYEAAIMVVENDPYLTYVSHTTTDSLDNNNGIPENGETILLRTLVKNVGLAAAINVTGILRSSDTLISIVDSVVNFGNLTPQDSSYGFSPFVFSVAPSCPNDHVVSFNISMSDTSNTIWSGGFSIIITNPFNVPTGPDQYGYYIYDDTDVMAGHAPVFDSEWVEIAPPGPGSIVSEITDEDADTVTVPLPFDFTYYGYDSVYNSIGLCSNGFMEMDYSTYRFGDPNDPIPSAGGPRLLIAPFWDDLDPELYGDIYDYYDSAKHCYIVEYKDCAHFGASTIRETFQVQFRDPQYYPTPTGDGEILFLYSQVADASSNTVGIEDSTENVGLQYVYNNNYDNNAAPIVNNRALLITTKLPNVIPSLPWLYIFSYTINDSVGGNNNGIPEPDETIDIYVDIQNNGDTTAYTVEGLLSSNDADVQILDANATFGDIAVGSTAGNQTDPYTAHVSATPSDSTIGLMLTLTANSGTYQKTDYFTLYIYEMTGVEEQKELAGQYAYGITVHPNPFCDNLTIAYGLQRTNAQNIALKIYDIAGRLIKSFPLQASASPMTGSITWDGTDNHSRRVAEGIYFVRMEADNFKHTEKVVFLK